MWVTVWCLFLALVSSYGNHKHVCFEIWSPWGVSGSREKQGGRVLSWQWGWGLISLPGTGEAPGGARQQGLQARVLLALLPAGPRHAQEALVSPCSDFLMDKQLPGS